MAFSRRSLIRIWWEAMGDHPWYGIRAAPFHCGRRQDSPARRKVRETHLCCVKTVDGTVYGIKRIMIPAFPVLRLMINRGTLHFHLAGAEITLKILHIIIRIPETPFHVGKERQLLLLLRPVRQHHPADLTGIVKRDKGQQVGLQPVSLPEKRAVSQSMPAFVGIQRGLGRLPARIPDAVSFMEIEIFAIVVRRARCCSDIVSDEAASRLCRSCSRRRCWK